MGGEISSSVLKHMNPYGRVSVCGSISVYNDEVLPKGKKAKESYMQILTKFASFNSYRSSTLFNSERTKNGRIPCASMERSLVRRS